MKTLLFEQDEAVFLICHPASMLRARCPPDSYRDGGSASDYNEISGGGGFTQTMPRLQAVASLARAIISARFLLHHLYHPCPMI